MPALLRLRNKVIDYSSLTIREALLFASLFLVRHGRHTDLGQRLTGRGEDSGLTADGRAEAEAARDALAAEPVAAVYASPRRRTVETAQVIADARRLPVTLAPALDEIDFGAWTGCRFDDLAGRPEWDRWNAQRSLARTPGGENMVEAQARAVAFAIQAAAAHDGAVVLVTHCDIIRALRCWNERRSLDDILSFDAPPGSVTPLPLLAAELEPA